MIDKAVKQYLDNLAKVCKYEEENERYILERCWFEEELDRQKEREQWEIRRNKKN